MFYKQPSIEFFGVIFETPMTAFTDVLVTVVCWYAYYQLRKINGDPVIKRYLLIYFASMGFATLVGGIMGHALIHYFNLYFKIPGWFTSMLSIAFIERACIVKARPFISNTTATIFSVLNIVELLTFMVLSFSTLNFLFVEFHTAYGFAVVVFSFSIFLYRRTRNRGNKLFIFAVIASAPAAIFFMSGIGIGPWFNHVDISHVFMMISAWLFYQGSKYMIADSPSTNG